MKLRHRARKEMVPFVDEGWRCSSVLEGLPSMCQSLGSIPSLKDIGINIIKDVKDLYSLGSGGTCFQFQYIETEAGGP